MSAGVLDVLSAGLAWLERQSVWALAGGLALVSVNHWVRWRQERRKARPPAAPPLALGENGAAPLVSVLLPAWNEADMIGACIVSILSLRYPRVELVVCAGGADDTYELAKRCVTDRATLLEQFPGEGKQHALQRCFDRSSGEILFLTDADCVLDDDCFEKVIEPVIRGAEEATTGSWQPLDAQLGSPFVVYQWTHSAPAEVTQPDYVYSLIGRSAAVRRQALERVGAFRSPVAIGTDLFLSNQLLSAGVRIRFVRDSRVRTRYSESVSAYWRQVSRWFRNPFLLGTSAGSTQRRLAAVRSGLAALAMLSGPLFGLLGGPLVWCLWAVAFWHLALSQLRATLLAQRLGAPRLKPRWRYLLFLLYMALSWVGTARGFVQGILPWSRWKW